MATPVFVALGASNPIVTSSTTDGSPITWNHTISAGDVLILVIISGSGVAPSSTPTYNSVAGTLIGSHTSGTGKGYMYGWKTPSTGTNTVSWTPDSTGVYVASATMSYSGADSGGTTWQNFTTNSGTTATPTLTVTSASGEKAIAGFGSRSFTPFATTSGTQRWLNDGTSLGQGVSERDDQASSVHNWSVGGSGDEWITLGFSLIGASGGGPVSISPSVGSAPVTGRAPGMGFGIDMPNQAMSITGKLIELVEIRNTGQILIAPA